MSKHPQRRPRPHGMSQRKYERYLHEGKVFKKTGEMSDWLARLVMRKSWARQELLPGLEPPRLDFEFTPEHYLTSSSMWWSSK